jgi:hypothetical protein
MSAASTFDTKRAKVFASGVWDEAILPALSKYIAIPNKSRAFA